MSKKDKGLYYLFPGQGRGKRKRLIMHLLVGLAVGLLVAGLMVAVFYFLGR
jgi:hypothetical protein